MNKALYSIQEVAKICGISKSTLRRWEESGLIAPLRTEGNQRRYTIEQIKQIKMREFPEIELENSQTSQSIEFDTDKRVVEISAYDNRWVVSPEPIQPNLSEQFVSTPEVQREAVVAEQPAPVLIAPALPSIKKSHPSFFSSRFFAVFVAGLLAIFTLGGLYIASERLLVMGESKAKLGSLTRTLSQWERGLWNKARGTLAGGSVLGSTTRTNQYTFKINVPAIFGERVSFLDPVRFAKGLSVTGIASLSGGIVTNNANIDVGTGTITASNILYNIRPGPNISISGDRQNPTISAIIPPSASFSGVLSFQGEKGDLSLTEGDGITIDGLEITNADPGSSQKIFKTVSVSGQSDIVAGSNTDTLTFAAGTGITLTTNASSKTMTIGAGTLSQWTQSNTNGVLYPNISTLDLLLGGSSTSSAKFGFLNVAGGTPTASISANSANNASFLTGAGNLGTTNAQTLTLGGATTGNIALSPGNGTGTLALNVGSLTVNGVTGVTDSSPQCVSVTRGIVTGTGVCQLGSEVWSVSNGAVFTSNSSLDLLLGGTATVSSKFAVLNMAGGTPTASISANSGNNALSLDGLGTIGTTNRQSLTLGNSSTGDVVIDSGTGTVRLADLTTNGFVRTTGSNGVLSVSTSINLAADVSGILPIVNGGSPFEQANGAIFERIATQDLLIGGTSTTSAKFAFMNVAGGTPTASISANSGNNAATLTGTGVLGTTNMQTLTIGNASTGNIVIDSGSDLITFSDAVTAASTLTTTGTLTADGTFTSNALASFNGTVNIGNGLGNVAINSNDWDISGAGVASGFTGFSSSGTITFSGFSSNGGVLYTNASGDVNQVTAGTANMILHGGTIPSFSALDLVNDTSGILPTSKGGSWWNSDLGAVYPGNSTLDLLIGDTASSGAKFAVLNVAGGTPTASVSAGTAGGVFLTATGNIQTTAKQSLTLGGGNTGNIVLSGFGTGIIHSDSNGVLSSSAINLANADVTGILGATNGGTGQNAVATGDLLYGSGTNTWSRLGIGGTGSVLTVSGGVPTWAASSTINFWQRTNGTIAPLHITDDLLLGATATTSAKFGFINVVGGTPTASISANSGNNALSLDGLGTVGTTNRQTLTLGTSSTGDIVIDSGTGTVKLADLTTNGFVKTTGLTGNLSVSSTINLGTEVSGILSTANGGSWWNASAGALYPGNSTLDLLVGGTATNSAKFAVLNVNSGTPTASVSATSTGTGVTFGGDGTIQSLRKGTLTIGGSTTGNIVIDSGSDLITLSDAVTAGSSLTVAGTLTGNGAVTLGDGGDDIAINSDDWDISGAGVASGLTGLSSSGTIAFSGLSTNGFVKTTGGTGTLSVSSTVDLGSEVSGILSISNGGSPFEQSSGAIFERITTQDFLIGGTSTTSAKFGFINVAGGTPTATISGNIVLDAVGSLQTTKLQTLTIGGTSTGNIAIDSGSGLITLSDAAAFSGLATFNAGATVASGQNLTLAGLNSNNNSVLYTNGSGVVGAATTTSTGLCLLSNGSGAAPSWGACDTSPGINLWQSASGTIQPRIITQDLLVGGTATNSAKFAVLNMNSGTPTASISANSGNNAVYMDGLGNIGTTNKQTLTLGTTSTGDINLVTSNLLINGTAGTTVATASCVTATNGIVVSSASCNLGNSGWSQNLGILYPNNATLDMAVGGTSTTSAKFAVLNVNSGTPTASVSAGTAGAAFLTASGNLQTTAKQSLTLGGGNTGNIVLSGFGAGIVHANASGVLSSSAVDLSSSDVTGILPIANGGSPFEQSSGAIFERITTQDFLIGGTSTTSAKFGFINVAGGTPTATISGNIVLNAVGSLQTTNNQTLTLGGGTTGNIVIANNAYFSTNLTLNGDTISDFTGDGLAVSSNALKVDILSSSASAGLANSRSGLELNVGAGSKPQLGLLQGCQHNQILKWNAPGGVWECSTDVGGQSQSSTTISVQEGSNSPLTGIDTVRFEGGQFDVSQQGSVAVVNMDSTLGLFRQANGAYYPALSTVDLLVGGSSTSSAKFAVLNINSGTPTASISASSGNNATTLSGSGVLGTTNMQTLAIGNASTGNIVIDAGSGLITLSDAVTAGSSLTIAGTLTGNGAVTLGDGGDDIAINSNDWDISGAGVGSGFTGFSSSGTIAFSGLSANGFVKTTGGTGTLSVSSTVDLASEVSGILSTANGGSWWNASAGALYPGNATLDLLVGGTASSGAKFAFKNVAGGTPTASISASSGNNATTLSGAGVLGTTNMQTLTLGNASTGNIVIDAGSGLITLSDAVTAGSSLTIAGTLTGNGAVTLGDGGDDIAINSDDWDISGAGVASGLTGLSSSGTIAFSGLSTNGFVKTTGGTGTLSVSSTVNLATEVSGILSTTNGGSWWNSSAGTLYPGNSTLDLLLGGTATVSSKFAFKNVAGGTPTASISASSGNNATTLAGSGVLGTTNMQTLTLGNTSTGDVVVDSGTGTVRLADLTTNGFVRTTGSNGALSVSTSVDLAADVSGILPIVNGGSPFEQANGAIFERIATQDLLIGGTSTTSAKFAFMNVAGGTPTASLSAGTTGGAYLNASGTLATTAKQSLTLRDSNTGNLMIYGFGQGVLHASASGMITSSPVSLINDVIDTLPVNLGGTNTTGIGSTGSIAYSNGSSYAFSGVGSTGNCLVSGGASTPTWASCALGNSTNWWNQTNGALYPINSTLDFLIGGTATTSAKFAVMNVAGGTPTASLSAGTTGGAYLNASGTLATTAKQTLNLGGSTTGDIVIDSGTGVVKMPDLTTDGPLYVTGGTLNSQAQLSLSMGGTGIDASGVTSGQILIGNASGQLALNTLTAGSGISISNGSGSITISQVGVGASKWTQNDAAGTVYPNISTLDLLVGGTASSAAKFAVLNVAGGTPTASVSAGIAGGAFLTATGNLQTTAKQTLTLGGGNSGNIVLSSAALFNNGATIASGQNLTLAGITGNNAVLYGTSGTGVVAGATTNTSSLCLLSGASAPSWATCPGAGSGVSKWTQSDANGALYPNLPTLDLLVGGSSTASAKFAVLNVNSGTPTASISASSGNNATTLSGAGVLGTTNMQTLTIGNASTGNIVINAGSGLITLSDPVTAASTLTATGTLTANGALAANGSVTLGDGGDDIAVNSNDWDISGAGVGSGFTGFSSSGTIAFSGLSTNGFVKTTGGTGTLSVSSTVSLASEVSGILPIANGGSPFESGSGAIHERITTQDLLIGGTSTASAKFGFINVAAGTPTATISGNIVLDAAGSLQTTERQTLTLGGTTTGNIVIDSGSSLITLADAAAFSGLATFNAGATVASGQNLTLAGITGNNAILYGTSGTGVVAGATTNSSSLCLMSGASTPTWSSCPGSGSGASKWTEGSGAIYPNNATLDLFVGGTTSSSAKFTVLNVSSGTPVASVSAGTSGASYLTAGGTLQTTARQSLTLGGNTTGNIILSNAARFNAGATVASGQSLTLAGLTSNNSILYATSGTGVVSNVTTNTSGLCLMSSAATPSWVTCPGGGSGVSKWTQDDASGILYPNVTTLDLLLGSNASNSAKFAFKNVAGGTPTASISANSGANALSLTGSGNIGTTNRQTLMLGTSSTGDVVLDSGTGTVRVADLTTNGVIYTSGSNGTLNSEAQLNVARGGTGISSLALGGLVYGAGGSSAFNTLSIGAANTVLTSTGTAPQWSTSLTIASVTPSGTTGQQGWWQRNSQALSPANITDDFLLGAFATTSAKFAVVNVAGGTPTASISANSGNNATTLSGTGVLGTTNKQTLTIGNSSTGNVVIDAGSDSITLSDAVTAASTLTTTGTLTANGTLDANGTVTLGDGGDDIAVNSNDWDISSAGIGSGFTGFSSSGTITFSGFSSNGGPLYTNGSGVVAQVTAGTANQVLHGGTTPSFSAVDLSADTSGILPTSKGGSWWNSSAGALYPGNATLDLLIGATSTTSAKFAFKNVAGGTPTASISGNIVLDAAGSLQTTKNQTLTIGGSTTGHIAFAPAGSTAVTMTSAGNVGIGTTTPLAKLDISGSATISGNMIFNAAATIGTTKRQMLTVGGTETGDVTIAGRGGANNGIFFSGYSTGIIHADSAGRLTSSALNLAGGSSEVTGTLDETNGGTGQSTVATGDLLYGSGTNTWGKLTIGSSGDILTVSGGVPQWSASSSINYWQRVNGALMPLNITDDFLLGSTATSSARFAFKNAVGSGTPIASISATSTGLVLGGDSTIQSLRNSTLTIGGNTTGNVVISPNNGSNGRLTLNAGLLFINGTQGVDVTSNAQCVLTTDGIVTGTGSCPAVASSDAWQSLNGAIVQGITTQDVLIGSTATSSAKFAFKNVNSGTPTASISGSTGAVYLTASGTLATTRKQSLTLGDSNTGNIVLANGQFATAGILHNSASGIITSSLLDLSDAVTDVTGTLGTANGGTGTASIGSAGRVAYSNGSAYAFTGVGTTGQALVSGGTGSPTWFAPTVGSLVFAGASGILSQDNSNLFWDDTDDQLGIGTASPVGKLHLTGKITGKALSIFNETGNQNIFSASASGTTRFVIENSGQVGIGTSNPISRLQVNANTLYSNNENSEHGLLIASGDSFSSESILYMGADETNTIGYIQAVGNSGFQNLVLQGRGGNVGVGVIAPTTKFEVEGVGNFHPTGVSPDNGYAGSSLRVTQAAASGQYINLIRSGQYAWSIGTVYNNSNFAIGSGQATDSNFTNPSFVIDTGGNVGIGTTNPTQKFMVSGGKAVVTHTDGNYGQLQVGNTTSNGEASIGFISGVTAFGATPTSTNGDANAWALGAGTGGAGLGKFGLYNKSFADNVMIWESSGEVGIGTTAPGNKLHVEAAAGVGQIRMRDTTAAAGRYWNIGEDSAGAFIVYNNNNTGVYVGYGNTSWSANSDVRLKENIELIPGEKSLDAIMRLHPVAYNWKNVDAEQIRQYGFLAQEVLDVFPEFVSIGPDTTIQLADGSEQTIVNPYGLSYTSFIVPAIRAIQELNQKVDGTKAEINSWGNIVTNVKDQVASQSARQMVMNDGLQNLSATVSAQQETLNNSQLTINSSLIDLQAHVASLEADLALLTSQVSLLTASSSGELGLDKLTVKDATMSGTLNVLGRATFNDVGITGKVNIGLLSINGLNDDGAAEINTTVGPLKIQSHGLYGMDILDGKVTIAQNGNMKVDGAVTVKKLNIDTAEVASASLGTATIIAGQSAVTIETTAVTAKSKIFVTPLTKYEEPLSVGTQTADESFTVELPAPATKNVKFNWFIIN